MPIKLSDISSRTKTITVPFEINGVEQEVKVTYRPGWYTVEQEEAYKAREAEAKEQQNTMRSAEERAKRLSEFLASWDVVDDKGKSYPTTYDALRKVDSNGFLVAIELACVKDMFPNLPTAETSGGIS